MIVHSDDQAGASIDDSGLHQVCTAGIDLDDNVRSFDLEFPGVGHVGG